MPHAKLRHYRPPRELAPRLFFSWFIKITQIVAYFCADVLLEPTGFGDPTPPVQLPEVLSRMMALHLILPLVIWGLGLLCARRHPLNHAKINDIYARLEASRGIVWPRPRP